MHWSHMPQLHCDSPLPISWLCIHLVLMLPNGRWVESLFRGGSITLNIWSLHKPSSLIFYWDCLSHSSLLHLWISSLFLLFFAEVSFSLKSICKFLLKKSLFFFNPLTWIIIKWIFTFLLCLPTTGQWSPKLKTWLMGRSLCWSFRMIGDGGGI